MLIYDTYMCVLVCMVVCTCLIEDWFNEEWLLVDVVLKLCACLWYFPNNYSLCLCFFTYFISVYSPEITNQLFLFLQSKFSCFSVYRAYIYVLIFFINKSMTDLVQFRFKSPAGMHLSLMSLRLLCISLANLAVQSR